jgi:hypothetical protein
LAGRDFVAIEYDGDQVIVFLRGVTFQMKILFQGVVVKDEPDAGVEIDFFDIALAEGGGNFQAIVKDRNFKVFAKAFYETEGRMDRKFKCHIL